MTSHNRKRPLEDGPHDDDWNPLQRLSDAHDIDTKPQKMMRHVTSQPPSEQGWGRCHAGFEDAIIEEKETDERSFSKRKDRLKRMSLETKKSDSEQGSSLDIEWSSSSDSLSDINPFPQEAKGHDVIKTTLQRKRTRRASKRRKSPAHQGSSVIKRGQSGSFLKEDEVDIAEEDETEGAVMKQSLATKKTSQSDDNKTTQINISDYDTPSEDELTATSSPQQASSSLHISEQSPTPQPSPNESPTKESPRTGTELLKKLRLPSRTPDKEDAIGGPGGTGDSAKKKRKFARGGLAEALQRVINREKSCSAFWAHRTADTSAPENLALDLLIMSVEEVRGLYVTRCRSCPLTSEVTEEMFVLFTQANWRQLKLSEGSRVRVHPPWQKLTLPNFKEPVILCTYFCHVLGGPEDDALDVTASQATYSSKTENKFSETQLKPVQLFQPVPNANQAGTTESILQSIRPHPTEAPNSHVSDSFLDSIAQSSAYSAMGMCIRALVHRVFFRGYSSVDTTGHTRNQPGTSRDTNEPTSQASHWSLMLQDKHRVFCELQLTLGSSNDAVEEEERWRRSLSLGGGQTMVFAGLKVMRRVNRTRSPGLFSLIDSLWSSSDASISQSDTESQDFRSQGLISPQNFCYILGVQTLRNTIREDEADRVRIPYTEPVIHTLRDIKQMSDTSSQRVTVFAKVIHAHADGVPSDTPQQPDRTSGWHLFLTDRSLSREAAIEKAEESRLLTASVAANTSGCSDDSQDARLVHLHVRASCHLMKSVRESLAIPGSLVFLRDLSLEQSDLYADAYTSIQRLARNNTAENDMVSFHTFDPEYDIIIDTMSHVPIPPIPDICLQSQEDTLVSVTGAVTGVDETTAYSWPECNICGNDRLDTYPTSGSQLHCGKCQRSVTSPLTRMHLEVFLHCPGLQDKETVVKVQLLQSSIEHVLPPISSQEEGYDLQSIMGVNIGPITCFLKTVTRPSDAPVTFELEEISLMTGL